MNVHFLELFYYVAKHRGISAAVREIPYGIQQPAVSTQIGKLEHDLGVKLFERTPFRLTAPGEQLYAYVGPFFEQMPSIAAQLRSAEETVLRIGGAELILRDHLPVVLREVKKQFPRLRYSLRSLGFQSEAEAWLRKGQLDVAFLPLHRKAPAGLTQQPMARLPLVLQVHPKSHYKSAGELWTKKKLSLPLICLPETSTVSQTFQNELKRRGIQWPQTIEASLLDLVNRYVANGDGIGVNVSTDLKKKYPGVRALTLEDFPPIVMGAIWSGHLSPAAKAAVDGVYRYAKKTWPSSVC